MGTVPAKPTRLLYIDWLRGLAVLLMFEAHLYPAWLAPSELQSAAFRWSNVLAGYAAPLFLFLAGVGMTMAMTSALARGKTWAESRRSALKRGFQLFLAALAFRLQELLLGAGPHSDLWRVDILNCIGASMMLAAWLAWPRERGLCAGRALGLMALVIAIAPLLTPVLRPGRAWPITSYLVDSRTWFFPLLPWSSYLFAGVFAGTLWSRAVAPASEGRSLWVMPLVALLGAGTVAACWLGRGVPGAAALLVGGSLREQPTYVLTHLGWIAVASAVAYFLQRAAHPERFGPMRQLGKTSLLMYWVHIELVYGHLAGPWVLHLKRQLTFAQASLGLGVLTGVMLALSWARTHYLGGFRAATLLENLWRETTSYVRQSWRKSRQG